MARCREAMPPSVHKPGRWGGDDSELDVFAAERYFNGDDALLCAHSSSSFSSAFRTGTTHEHDQSAATATAATSSSEASWNSRSALLHDGRVLPAAASPSVVEAEPRGTGGEPPRGKLSPPSSHLRRWLLGVAGFACIGGDGEESVSADDLYRYEVEDGNVVGTGGEKLTDRAGELFRRTESMELAVVEATSVRVRSGRWLNDGDEFLAGKAASSPIQGQLAGNGHRQAVNSGDFSMPILNHTTTTTTALLHEQRRRSCEVLRPPDDIGSALVSRKQDSAFTIVAGNTARGGGVLTAATGEGSPAAPRRPCISPCGTSEDDAAPSELGCPYPPSEASVVWSVVTAEGAASCSFSSAASGYYYRFNGGDDGAMRHAVGRSNRRRRSRVANSGGLLTCMGDKAVNAVGPARRLGPSCRPEFEPTSMDRLRARSDGRSMPSAEYPDLMRRR